MISFTKGTIGPLLKKEWFWFKDPHDVRNRAWVMFFSYDEVVAPGFNTTEGWTSVIDLNESRETLWKNIREKYSRAPIEAGERQGIVIKIDKNFSEFDVIYRQFRRAKNISKDDTSLFRNGILFSAYFEGKMIAGHIFLSDGKYFRSWAASSKRFDVSRGRDMRLVGQANRMLIWEAIKYAKETDCELFDLGGIDINDKTHLLEYKESFGGKRVKNYYYVKVYSPILRFLSWIKGRLK